ncbi:MAG: hypothetical protein HYT89_02405 [Candidatus Omnitrophica bacterium]|nr:hypothetical protein [Candidatus Omnitrophota bacterium]
MKDYQSWHFRDRAFAMGVALSLAWHFFWFFAITITVSPEKMRQHPRPRIVSLGPVLDDTLLRTLVETRPQPSEAFYRHMTDFTPVTGAPPKTVGRAAPADVISLPYEKKLSAFLRNALSGEKASPVDEFLPKIKTGYPDDGPSEKE